jgi:Relaxase/Mobilisation nuclease domain
MIVNGKSRAAPAQLAAYLLRQDGKERPVLVELLDGGKDLNKAFLQWHAIGELTRGEHTLYHAQIAPENRYAMTPEQWKRAAEILAEELGMKDHPRAIVVHEGHKNPHAHVVFQRADDETMTLWDDGFNYIKHERASARMEKEFGHEPVPGKHAKRDREKQPEFPREDCSTEEAQRDKRAGIKTADRKAEIMALYQGTDSGTALKVALEEAGYLLAKGDRGYLVVDETGGHSVLTRNTGLKKKELEAYMAGIPLDSLPTVDEAKALQKAAALAKKSAASSTDGAAEGERQGVEASKFLPAAKEKQTAPGRGTAALWQHRADQGH